MAAYPDYHNYDLHPVTDVHGFDGAVVSGWDAVMDVLASELASGRRRICFELYPGVDEDALARQIARKTGVRVFRSLQARLAEAELLSRFSAYITDDRVFGRMYSGSLEDCFDPDILRQLQGEIRDCPDPCIALGTGAALLMPDADSLWHWDLTRWEIQLRMRRGMGTWMCGIMDGQQLTKYKVGYFMEWRMADRMKRSLSGRIRFRVDADDPSLPRLIPEDAYLSALDQTARKPFRMQAYYDPSVWGGQWMKHVFGLDPEVPNYGWSFDGVPEENALCFRFGTDTITFPAINLVHARPLPLLGEHVYGRFGAEFPIRFDFLDTMEGGNLSLQVHPMTEYIQKTFGMQYTQDESYYILDATDESCVYLGVKPGMDLKAFEAALREAQSGACPLDAERFVNRFPVKKHDHVLIPAGTVHCSGKNTVVLEISATPYIFTFKLWDWGRVGLDGLPRPVHIDHGIANIQADRDTAFCEKNLLHQETVTARDAGGTVEHTGLHSLEFIETERHTLLGSRVIDVHDSVNVLNLVEGREAWIESTDGSFPPAVIHYSETFIVPAAVGQYVLKSSENVMVLCARVR